jgi:hypothetical protein
MKDFNDIYKNKKDLSNRKAKGRSSSSRRRREHREKLLFVFRLRGRKQTDLQFPKKQGETFDLSALSAERKIEYLHSAFSLTRAKRAVRISAHCFLAALADIKKAGAFQRCRPLLTLRVDLVFNDQLHESVIIGIPPGACRLIDFIKVVFKIQISHGVQMIDDAGRPLGFVPGAACLDVADRLLVIVCL